MEMQISLVWPDLAHLRKQKKASGKSLLCFTFQTTDAVLVRRISQKAEWGVEIKVAVENRRGGHPRESRRVRDVHIPEVLSGRCRGPWWRAVKAPGCGRRTPRPERAAPPRDTSPSSAACGSETGPRCAGRRELRPGTSTGLEEERQTGAVTNHGATVGRLSWFEQRLKGPTVTLDASIFKLPLELHAVVAAENASALELSVGKFPLVPGMVGGEALVKLSSRLGVKLFSFCLTNLDPSVKKSTPEPWNSPFSNWPE